MHNVLIHALVTLLHFFLFPCAPDCKWNSALYWSWICYLVWKWSVTVGERLYISKCRKDVQHMCSRALRAHWHVHIYTCGCGWRTDTLWFDIVNIVWMINSTAAGLDGGSYGFESDIKSDWGLFNPHKVNFGSYRSVLSNIPFLFCVWQIPGHCQALTESQVVPLHCHLCAFRHSFLSL